jgi:hypothetical protein
LLESCASTLLKVDVPWARTDETGTSMSATAMQKRGRVKFLKDGRGKFFIVLVFMIYSPPL